MCMNKPFDNAEKFQWHSCTHNRIHDSKWDAIATNDLYHE